MEYGVGGVGAGVGDGVGAWGCPVTGSGNVGGMGTSGGPHAPPTNNNILTNSGGRYHLALFILHLLVLLVAYYRLQSVSIVRCFTGQANLFRCWKLNIPLES